MDITLELIIGTITGFITMAIISIYKKFRDRKARTSTKAKLGIHGEKCLVTTPIYGLDEEKGLVHHRYIYSLTYVTSLLFKIGIEPTIMPYHQVPENSPPMDEFCIGGGYANKRGGHIAKLYCPQFQAIPNEESDPEKRERDWLIIGSKIGSETLMREGDIEYTFLIKIKTENKKTYHLIIGQSTFGTASGAYFLAEHFHEIGDIAKNSRYFVALKTNRRLGHKSVEFHKDYSGVAFESIAMKS